MEYTNTQVALIKRFCDIYRSAPETLTLSDRFVSFSLTTPEIADLKMLVDQQLIDHKYVLTHPDGAQNLYRLADNLLPDLRQMKVDGRIEF